MIYYLLKFDTASVLDSKSARSQLSSTGVYTFRPVTRFDPLVH